VKGARVHSVYEIKLEVVVEKYLKISATERYSMTIVQTSKLMCVAWQLE
jgi:hypothetical protein